MQPLEDSQVPVVVGTSTSLGGGSGLGMESQLALFQGVSGVARAWHLGAAAPALVPAYMQDLRVPPQSIVASHSGPSVGPFPLVLPGTPSTRYWP